MLVKFHGYWTQVTMFGFSLLSSMLSCLDLSLRDTLPADLSIAKVLTGRQIE